MKMKRILVTNVSSDSGLSVLSELAVQGHELIGADWQRLPFGIHSRHIAKVHELPSPTDPGFDQRLIELVGFTQPDAFLPLGTRNTLAACREASALEGLTSANVPSHEAFLAAFDHSACNAELAELGIPCPVTYCTEEAARLLEAFRGEVTLVVKPHTDVGKASGVSYVRDTQALQLNVAACTSRYGGVTIQEYIPGDATAMRTVIVLFDRRSEPVAAFTTRKLRHHPVTGGLTVLSESTAELELVEQVLPFFMKWQWRGAAEVELKFDARDRQFKVIEINPRFPAYLRFPMICGLPMARLATALTLGDEAVNPLKFPSYKIGMKYINPGLFLRSVRADFRSAPFGLVSLKRAVADLAGCVPAISGMLGDPLPMAGRLLLDARNLLGLSSPP